MKVLVCDPVSISCLNELKSAGLEVIYSPKITPQELLDGIHDFDGVIIRSRSKINSNVIELGTKLKAVGRAGVGLDNVDLDAAAKHNISVFNTPEAPSEGVAELVLGLMIGLSRKISIGDSSIKSGKWLKGEMLGFELLGKTLGVIGFGRIGRKVSYLAKAFGMKILVYDVIDLSADNLKPLDAKFCDLDDLLSKSDYVSLHIPLTPKTKYIINREKLAKMKKNSYLLNTSRGKVIDETALFEAISKGIIAGAGLDVFEKEPPDSGICSLPNVICTPHIGAQTREAQDSSGVLIAEKLISALNKEDKG